MGRKGSAAPCKPGMCLAVLVLDAAIGDDSSRSYYPFSI